MSAFFLHRIEKSVYAAEHSLTCHLFYSSLCAGVFVACLLPQCSKDAMHHQDTQPKLNPRNFAARGTATCLLARPKSCLPLHPEPRHVADLTVAPLTISVMC